MSLEKLGNLFELIFFYLKNLFNFNKEEDEEEINIKMKRIVT